MRRGTIILLALILCYSAYAQHDSVIVIADVMVTENRIKVPISKKPAPVYVIDALTIQSTPGISLADILGQVPGVDMRQRGINGIQTDAGIRGSSFDQVLVLLNGVRMSDSQTGHHNFNLPVDASMIERIEIFKGSSARVFGQNAFAGAINIITKTTDDNYLNIKSFAGSFGLFGGSVSGSLNSRTTRNHFSAGRNRSDGYRYNTDYSLANFLFQGEVVTGAGTVNYMAGLSDRNFGANGFYSGPSFPDQYEEITTSVTSVTFRPKLSSPSLELTTRLYWRRNDDNYLLRRQQPEYYRNIHLTNTAGADLNATWYSKAGITGLGIEITTGSIKSSRLGEHIRYGVAVFAEHRFNLLKERLSLTPGIQLNHSTGFGTSLLPGIDAGFTINEKLMLFLNSGYTFRVPTFTDLYYEDPGNSGNPLLKPEFSLSHEAGLKTIKSKWLQAQASVFSRRGFNLIDRIKENETDRWMPSNIRETVFNGFETEVSASPGSQPAGSFFRVSRVSAGYNFTHSVSVGSEPLFSRFALENLRNQFVVSTTLVYGARLSHNIMVRYTDRVSGDDYFVADTRLLLSLQNISIFAEILNLGGTVYYETWQVMMPGRWFRFGIEWKKQL